MRPYRLIRKTTRHQLSERILDTFISWQKRWSIDIKQPIIDFPSDKEDLEKSIGFGVRRDNFYQAFFFDVKTDWAKIIFGHKSISCPDDAIAHAVINDAKQSLADELLRQFNIYETVGIVRESASITPVAGDGHVIVKISIDDQNLYLWLSPHIVSAFIPAPSKHNSRALVPRADACVNAVATYKAKLDLGSFPITLLQNLSIGDVLSTDIKLDTPMYLEINGNMTLRAHLGQQDGKKALLFLSN